MVSWVNRRNAFSGDIFVPNSNVARLSRVCRDQSWEVPERFTLKPVNSKALLIQWRVLFILLNGLTEEDRQKFRLGEVRKAVACDEELQIVDSIGFEERTSTSESDLRKTSILTSMLTT